jgi:hypothetical protein
MAGKLGWRKEATMTLCDFTETWRREIRWKRRR